MYIDRSGRAYVTTKPWSSYTVLGDPAGLGG
jgi:hypothetical protein